ncbi:MAG: hypothetical protein A2252_02615 [Elusimicrobia bacterium RIFOXYA2_FULL_39_19]|nr:MAG: hypothetical protein A2252_02615 [Elusimicrobia bacterium RIFOXYA2_FULL_39_19]
MSKLLKIIICLSATLLICGNILNAKGTNLYAVVTKIEGTVVFQPENSTKWHKAKTGLGLLKGDTLKTSVNSRIIIVIEGGTTFKIEQNTKIQIEALVTDFKSKKCEVGLNLPEKGSVYSSIPKNKKNRFSIKTPVCTASVRGTGLAVDVIDEETTSITVFEGKVIVKDFVAEAGLSADGNEMLLDFLHEISMQADQTTTVTTKGINQPEKIKDNQLAQKEEFNKLKQESENIQKSWNKTSFEKRNTDRNAVREEALSKGE